VSDERARRVGLNEALFRQVNEQIEELNRTFGADVPAMAVICECADGGCTERMEVPVAEYEAVRRDPRRYLVVPGHETPEFESVVESRDDWLVVEKEGEVPVELSEETDPRS
jgi:hypothetical protein